MRKMRICKNRIGNIGKKMVGGGGERERRKKA